MSSDRSDELLASLRSRIEAIETGQTIESEQLTEVEETEDAAKARGIILRQLNAGPKTRHQLFNKLVEAEIDADLANGLLDRYTELRLIDDAQFARDWVAQRHEIRGLAPLMLRRELNERGVAEEYIDEALQQLDRDDERSRARELLEKKLRTIPLMDPTNPDFRKEREKYTRRLVSHLQRKGYNPGLAFSLVGEALDEHQTMI